MRRTLLFVLTLIMTLSFAALTSAGNGFKVETAGLNAYTAAGIDLELGVPGVPLRPFTEVLGWWASNDHQVTHLQAGLGARFYITSSSTGLFAEARMRYIAPFGDTAEASSAIVAGLGYRLRPLIGGIDIYAATTLSENNVLPKYLFGARVGF